MILPKLISPPQSALVPNRDTHDNTLTGDVILTSFGKRCSKKEYMVIRLGMEKAFRLDCDFIRKCFTDLGFCDRWINWLCNV